MTTYSIPAADQGPELTAALTRALEIAPRDPDVHAALVGLRVAANDDNHATVAAVGWNERPAVAAVLRQVAAELAGPDAAPSLSSVGTVNPTAAKLRDIAGGLEQALRQRLVNN